MGEKYEFKFTKRDATSWLKASLIKNIPIQQIIKQNTKDKKEYDAAVGYFCRAYFLNFKGDKKDE